MYYLYILKVLWLAHLSFRRFSGLSLEMCLNKELNVMEKDSSS
jgi:hypothetical protein